MLDRVDPVEGTLAEEPMVRVKIVRVSKLTSDSLENHSA